MKQYLKYYIGGKGIVYFEDEKGKYTIERDCRLSIDYQEDDDVIPVWIPLPSDDISEFDNCDRKFKPILHRLEDMDEDTMIGVIRLLFEGEQLINSCHYSKEWDCIEYDNGFCFPAGGIQWEAIYFNQISASQFDYLLGGNEQGKYYDLFKLIDSGDAIDIKTLGK